MIYGETLFYSGIAAMVAAVLLGIAALVVFKLQSSKLKRLLDVEYGEREKNN